MINFLTHLAAVVGRPVVVHYYYYPTYYLPTIYPTYPTTALYEGTPKPVPPHYDQ